MESWRVEVYLRQWMESECVCGAVSLGKGSLGLEEESFGAGGGIEMGTRVSGRGGGLLGLEGKVVARKSSKLSGKFGGRVC